MLANLDAPPVLPVSLSVIKPLPIGLDPFLLNIPGMFIIDR
jgi:hypothetical protein